MKKTIFKKISFFLILSVLLGSYLVAVSASRADDDEGEERDRWEDDDRDDERQETPLAAPSVQTPRVNQKPVKGTSGPDQAALLVSLQDSDQDGIVDNADKYPGQDDFSFIIVDNNRNGIADDLELLIGQ